MTDNSLRITEIFYSLQGETTFSGLPTVFVRLTGCPLRCRWCDTAYAFEGGQRMEIEDILEQVDAYKPGYVTVTGGEPLAQPNCVALVRSLADKDYQVSVETSGALPVGDLDPRCHVILDLKPPSSAESHRNDWTNIANLKRSDQIKFVIGSREDYDWSKAKILEYGLGSRVDEILFSPVQGELDPTRLADWILEDRLPVRLQLQLHKLLWNDEPGH